MDKKPLIPERKQDRTEHEECCELYQEYCYPCKVPSSTDEKKKK